MAANKKTVRKGFDYLHCDDFAAYLGKMARQGWHFRKFSAGLVFEKGEPEDAVYAVEVFIDGTEYDTRPEPHTKEFAEYCEAAGWQLIDAQRKFCVFKKVREDALDILTPEERLANIAKEEQKTIWQHLGISTVWTILNWVNFTSSTFVYNIFSNTRLITSALWVLIFVTSLCRCIHFYVWKSSARRKICRGEDIYFGKKQKSGLAFYSWHSWAGVVVFFMYLAASLYLGRISSFILYAVILAAALVTGFLVGKFRPDANTNALIQNIVPMVLILGVMIFTVRLSYNSSINKSDPSSIPLFYEDIGSAGELTDTRTYGDAGILGSRASYFLYYDDSSIYYTIYRSGHGWILDRIWEEETDGKANEIKTDCTDAWGAETAFRNPNGSYYIRHADTILILNVGEDFYLTPEQIAIIREKLELR